jgi:hypothetical protein
MVVLLIFKGGELALVLLIIYFDICILQVNQGCFLVRSKEHVLPIIMDSLEGLDAIVVKAGRADISRTDIARPEMLF